MRIAVVNFTSGGMSGGYRKYLKSIIPRIAADKRVQKIDMLAPPGMRPESLLDFVDAHPWPPGDRYRPFIAMRKSLALLRPDIVFVPTARWADCGPLRVVTMVRNMEPLAIPYSAIAPFEIVRNLARRSVALRSVVRSDGVIAVSAYVRDFLRQNCYVGENQVAVIYHGVEHGAGSASGFDVQRTKLGEGPFVFTAGSIRPARGLPEVIRAFSQIRDKFAGVKLAVGGSVDRGMLWHYAQLRRLARNLGCENEVVWLGQMTDAEMAWAFEKSAAFVMSSHVEACPNIALEALAQGSVCVSTNNPPMPEIFATSAEYYTARDSNSLAHVLLNVLTLSNEGRARMRAAARKRATDFNWDRSATATVDFFASLISRRD